MWVDNVVVTAAIPGSPTGLSVSQGMGELTGSWLPVAGATSYTCTLDFGYGSPSSFTVTTTSTSCSFGGVSAHDSYGISVVANGPGGSSAPVSAFTSPAPAAPAPPPVTHHHPDHDLPEGHDRDLQGPERRPPHRSKGFHRV